VHVSGVVVSNLEKNKKLREYLKQGDVILYLNGVPCIKSCDAIDLIRHYDETCGMLKIELEDKKEKETENSIFLCCINLFRRKKI
jgi:PDZ domain-containing secreted protein